MTPSLFAYYLRLALRSFRRDKINTALIVLALAIGVGACTTTMTVFHILSRDPIPGKSQRLFHPQLDSEDMAKYLPNRNPQKQLTRFDAETLLKQKRADRQAMMASGLVAVESEGGQRAPFMTEARYTTADFFPMFEPPFLHGSFWNAADDDAAAPVAVISRELNERLFGHDNGVGRRIVLNGNSFRVLGVLDRWRVTPQFYDMGVRDFAHQDHVFVPFSTFMQYQLPRTGITNCWGSVRDPYAANSTCAWLQYWVQLDTPEKVEAYRRYLHNYSEQQREAGRFQRPTNIRLRNVMEWLDYNKVIPRDVRIQVWLAAGLLALCLINAVGLLLAKFLHRGAEIGIRRALGASQLSIFQQHLVECLCIGLAGALPGLGIAVFGLWVIRQLPGDYTQLAQIDAITLVGALGFAIVSSLLAGLLPTWRASRLRRSAA